MEIFNKPLFIFEMANNHQGKIEHGIRIIREISQVCEKYRGYFNFAFKLQYRDLNTFIHPDYRNRLDLKNIKRFSETRLTNNEFKVLKDEIAKNGFYSICTAFDENSVELIDEHDYDIIKIASCSLTDWPLLEAITKIQKPVIASTAGSELEEVDRVVNFFLHREIDLSLMHCVAEYPTKPENLQLNQINVLKDRYKIRVGYSTHESPVNFDAVRIAIGQGSEIFEKHVGVPTETIELNGYSANPQQVEKWINAAHEAFLMCGVKNRRYRFTNQEKADLLALRRGVFAKTNISKKEKIDSNNTFYAFPCSEGQLLTNDLSKYSEFILMADGLEKNKPVMLADVNTINNEVRVQNEVIKIISVLKKGNVVIPLNSECEISHHYGIDEFNKFGASIINCVNREYCKKIMVLIPGQQHPNHYHKLKEETFSILYGDLILNLDGEEKVYHPGESVIIERNVAHSFASKNGCVFEEISTTHYLEDSYYQDIDIQNNQNRKTKVYITKQLLDDFKLGDA